MAHKFDPAHADRLDSDERRSWQPPDLILTGLDLREGEILLDVGCGSGYFSVPAARLVGPAGRVYAVDISLEMLMQVGRRIYAEGLVNVETVLSRETNIPLPDACADAALLANVLHEAEDRPALLGEVHRLVRPGGRLLVVDWVKTETPAGPPVADRLEPEAAEAEAAAAGWRLRGPAEAGPYHWGRLFERV